MGAWDPDAKKASLFSVEPSGLVFKYQGQAVGKGRQVARTEIEKLLAGDGASNLTCKAALKNVAKILHKVHDEKDTNFELECAWISADSDYKFQHVPAEMIKEAEEKAKQELEDDDEND